MLAIADTTPPTKGCCEGHHKKQTCNTRRCSMADSNCLHPQKACAGVVDVAVDETVLSCRCWSCAASYQRNLIREQPATQVQLLLLLLLPFNYMCHLPLGLTDPLRGFLMPVSPSCCPFLLHAMANLIRVSSSSTYCGTAAQMSSSSRIFRR